MQKHLGNAYHVINLFEHISCILDAFQVFVEEVSNLEYLAYNEVFTVVN